RAPSSLLTTNGTTATQLYTLSLHDALPIYARKRARDAFDGGIAAVDQELRRRAAGEQVRLEVRRNPDADVDLAAAQRFFERARRSEEHTSELQSRENLVCRLLLEKKQK